MKKRCFPVRGNHNVKWFCCWWWCNRGPSLNQKLRSDPWELYHYFNKLAWNKGPNQARRNGEGFLRLISLKLASNFLSGDFGPKSLFQSLGAACWRISEREQQSLLHDLFDWFSMLWKLNLAFFLFFFPKIPETSIFFFFPARIVYWVVICCHLHDLQCIQKFNVMAFY